MMSLATHAASAVKRFRPALVGLFLAAFVGIVAVPGTAQEKRDGERPARPKASRSEAPAIFIRFTDDRIMKWTAGREALVLDTPYGKLHIPLASIRSIDFATRIPEADARRAEAAVANLGSPQFRVRRAAEAEILKLREKASPALHAALNNHDVEVIARAQNLLDKLTHLVPEDQLEVRPQDVIRTADSRIAGRIEGTDLRVQAFPSGKGPEKLPLTSLRSLAVGVDPRAINAQPDPGNLQAFQGQIGKTFWFKVTGAVNAPIWGTKTYTSDSALASTAVHAGLLKVGQTAVVRVKIVSPPASYEGSTKNGVVSQPYGAWPGAYQFIR
jgi:hypothetical protein